VDPLDPDPEHWNIRLKTPITGKQIEKGSPTTIKHHKLRKSVLRIHIFWASRSRINQSEVCIRIFLSPSKNSKENLDSYCFVPSFARFIFKNEVLYLLKVPNKQSNTPFFQISRYLHLEGQWLK
jgi:hypothetical protein